MEVHLELHIGRFGLGRSGQSDDAEGPHRGVLQDVDPAELCGGILEGLGERVTVQHVRGDCGGGDAFRGELADDDEIVELGAVPGDQGDIEAEGAEGASDWAMRP